MTATVATRKRRGSETQNCVAAWNPPAYANAWLPAWEALPRRRISAVPPWCGQCQSDDYRWVELDDGRAAHCPRCHPSTVRSA